MWEGSCKKIKGVDRMALSKECKHYINNSGKKISVKSVNDHFLEIGKIYPKEIFAMMQYDGNTPYPVGSGMSKRAIIEFEAPDGTYKKGQIVWDGSLGCNTAYKTAYALSTKKDPYGDTHYGFKTRVTTKVYHGDGRVKATIGAGTTVWTDGLSDCGTNKGNLMWISGYGSGPLYTAGYWVDLKLQDNRTMANEVAVYGSW